MKNRKWGSAEARRSYVRILIHYGRWLDGRKNGYKSRPDPWDGAEDSQDRSFRGRKMIILMMRPMNDAEFYICFTISTGKWGTKMITEGTWPLRSPAIGLWDTKLCFSWWPAANLICTFFFYHCLLVTIVIFILTLVCSHFSLTRYSCRLVMFIWGQTVVKL